MQANHGETKQKFADEIAIAYGIHAVLADARKAKLACDASAVQNDCRSSERAGTKRENICSDEAIAKALRVAFKSFDLSEQVMAERDRLGALQMRVTGHQQIDVLLSEAEQRGLQISQPIRDFCDLGFYIKPKIERHLIVPAARGMKLSADGAKSFCQRRLDVHVDIFERLIPPELTGFDFILDLAQFVLDLLPLIGGYNSRLGQRSGVRD